jgi:hypothetical protein
LSNLTQSVLLWLACRVRFHGQVVTRIPSPSVDGDPSTIDRLSIRLQPIRLWAYAGLMRPALKRRRRGGEMKLIYLVIFTTTPLASYSQQEKQISADIQSAQIVALRDQVKALEQRIDALSKTYGDIYVDVADLQSQTASFDPTEPNKFSSIRSSVGPLLIVYKGAAQYLNGYRIALEIGNPHSARITNYDVTATWSANFSDSRDHDFIAWFNKKKKKNFHSLIPLEPGHWTKLWVILPNTAASEFETVEIKIDVLSVDMPITPTSQNAVQ